MLKAMKRSFEAASPFPIYFFAICTLIWGSLCYRDGFFKYVMLGIGIISLINLKFQKFWLLIASSLFFCFWWAYVTLHTSLNNGFPAFLLMLETSAMIYLAYSIYRFKNLPCFLNDFKVKNW
jgi:hypothetical protein